MKSLLSISGRFVAMLALTFLFVTTLNAAKITAKEFNVEGLKVILKQTPKDVISVRLFVEGGTANYPKAKEGIEELAFSVAITGGTTTLDKLAFNNAAEKLGTEFGSSTSLDYGDLNMSCVKMFWDKSWDLFADAILNPAFDPKEFKLQQEKAVSTAKQNASNPDQHLREIAMKNAFKGSNYEKIAAGTPESLEGISLAELKSYYKSTVGKKRVFLVVVGNVTEEDLTLKIKKSLSRLQEGTPANFEKRNLITESGTFIENRDIATNYIRGVMSAPIITEPEAIPMRVAMSILSDRFFLELRTKRSLSYAPAASFSYGVIKNPYSVLYISTKDPKQSIQVMTDIIDSIKSFGFKESELVNTKQTFLTHYFMGQETTSSQSMTLGAAVIGGDLKLADTFTDRVNAVTLKDMDRAFDKYTRAIKWTYLGKEDAVKKDDFKQLDNSPSKNRPY